jgi:hypothetical protein
VEDMIIDDPDD